MSSLAAAGLKSLRYIWVTNSIKWIPFSILLRQIYSWKSSLIPVAVSWDNPGPDLWFPPSPHWGWGGGEGPQVQFWKTNLEGCCCDTWGTVRLQSVPLGPSSFMEQDAEAEADMVDYHPAVELTLQSTFFISVLVRLYCIMWQFTFICLWRQSSGSTANHSTVVPPLICFKYRKCIQFW